MSDDNKQPATAQRPKLTLHRGAVVRPAVTASAVEAEAWVVWGEGRRGPRVRHPSKAIALAEADRLAALDPGRRFDVYALVPVGKALR